MENELKQKHLSSATRNPHPSRLNIPDVTYHAAFRLIEQAAKSKTSFFSKIERCSVRRRDSEDHLTGFFRRSQIFIREVYGP
jgi:hypothetical protein